MNKTEFQKIVVLTGAGISAESGLGTFRDSQGLWEKYRIEEVATPEAFERNPQLVWKFYSMRRIEAAKAGPNPAHYALVEFAKLKKANIHLITQNVDGLHQRSDPDEDLPPICMHGSLNQSRCTKCDTAYLDGHAFYDLDGRFSPKETSLLTTEQKAHELYLHHFKISFKDSLPLSPCCKSFLRPHIVWFGEMPFHMAKINKLLIEADLFISIGTSGQVYPAAGFLQVAKASGAKTICINKEIIPQEKYIDEFIEGSATIKVPEFLKTL